jgi:hypothetical protein
MSNLTPYGLYQTYRYLDVPLLDGTRISGLDVHEYRNNSLGGDFSTVSGVKAYDELSKLVFKNYKLIARGTYRSTIRPETSRDSPNSTRTVFRAGVITTQELYRPFVGKGSPEDVRAVLRTAIDLGVLPANRSTMQDYCDRNIGLDCSGLARAYYGNDTWSAEHTIAQAKNNWKSISKLDDVRPGDSLIWNSCKHIALIDSIKLVEKEQGITYCLTCSVVESTADAMETDGPSDGLNYTEYLLLHDGPGKIKVMRPYAKSHTSYDSPSACVRRP